MERGLVTVMVPSYNYARFLPDAVESAATQADVATDVVIVDNGSTDDSVEVALALAERHANVRVVRHATNDGIIASFNRCRDEVRGEMCSLLPADDYLAPGSLSRAVRLITAMPDVGFVYGPAIDFGVTAEIDPSLFATSPGDPIVYAGDDWVSRRCGAGTNPIRSPEVVMRTALADAVGPYDPALPFTSDLRMWLGIAARADVAFIPGPVAALCRKHGGNYGQAFIGPGAGRHDLEQRWEAFSRFFESLPVDHPRRERWEADVRSALGSEARYMATRAYTRPLGEVPPDEHMALRSAAAALDPGGETSVERWAWHLRQRLGRRGARRFPGFLLRPTMRRLGRIAAERRRIRCGV